MSRLLNGVLLEMISCLVSTEDLLERDWRLILPLISILGDRDFEHLLLYRLSDDWCFRFLNSLRNTILGKLLMYVLSNNEELRLNVSFAQLGRCCLSVSSAHDPLDHRNNFCL